MLHEETLIFIGLLVNTHFTTACDGVNHLHRNCSSMPSQRSKTKKMVGGYVDQKLYDAIAAIAKREGKTIKDVAEDMLREGATRRGVKVPRTLAIAE